ncbi:MAG: S41 family peptidase [Alphaproteobacteria bacterium]|nr:S41 family peptidase [Alphaproteobacteria bacterium]
MGKSHKKKWGPPPPSSVLVVASLLFSACAAERPLSEVPPADTPAAVFAAGYGGIVAKYIEPRTARELALESLEGLADADPALNLKVQGRLLRLSRDDRLLRVGVAPPPQSIDGWADLSADFLAVSLANQPAGADRDAFMAAMFDRALGSLDEYSRYAAAPQAQRQREKRKGYSGVGLHVHAFEGVVLVTDVIPGSPANKAGIRTSDELLKINGLSVDGLDIDDVHDWLRGPVSSRLDLVLRRPDAAEPFEVTLHRRHIFAPTVEYKHRDSIAHIQLSGFNRDTARSLTRHLQKIPEKTGKPLRGIVFDLRDNPGGLMDQAIAVADLFLESDGIIYTRGRHPNSSQTYSAAPGDISGGVPMVVLLNGKSASSAEIVAAALQTRHRALVVGSRSYGKGTVQTVIPLPNGAEITLTWSLLYTPSGEPLNQLGVLPDICTAGLKEKAPSPLRALAGGKSAGKTACPTAHAESPLDLPIAEELLGNAALYASLLQETHEEIAATAKPPPGN